MIAFLGILQKRTAPVGQGKLQPSFLPILSWKTKGELGQTVKPWSMWILPAQENHMGLRKDRRELVAEGKSQNGEISA